MNMAAITHVLNVLTNTISDWMENAKKQVNFAKLMTKVQVNALVVFLVLRLWMESASWD